MKQIPIKDLTLLEDNPRQVRTGAIERLAKSLNTPRGRALFAKRPCLANDRDGKLIVYAGNQRLRAAKSLGWETVPCIVEKISLKEEREEAIKDNLVIGEWDDDLLANNFDLEDLEGWGMDLKELGIEPLGDDETDEVPEPPKEARAERGKIYQLGKHRVMCGDSTNAGDVALLMDGNKADMVFTDPPYRMNAEGGSNQWVGRIAAKVGESIKDIISFEPKSWLGTLPLYFEKGMNAYIFCNKDLIPDYLNWALECKFSFNVLFWKKPTALPLGEQHRPDVEYLITIRKNSVWNNAVPGVNYSKCLDFVRENSTNHPTMKPVGLISNEIKISSNQGGIVIDDFLGSGSTLIACEQTGRICYGMEIDPKYVDVIIERFCNYTGQDKEEIYGSAH